MQEFIHEMQPLMDNLQNSMVKSEAGIVFSFEQEYAFQIQPHHRDLSYIGQVQKYYRALYEQNIPVDFVPADSDFQKYRLLIAPLQYLMSPELEDKYMEYVRQGGHLVLTMRTGVKDMNNLCMTEFELPGRLAQLAGVEVLDYDCLRDDEVNVLFEGESLQAYIWSDLMRLLPGTKVLASYNSQFYAGEPCMTEHSYGKGICYYVGTQPGDVLMDKFMAQICRKAGVNSILPPVAEVECTIRENDKERFLFVINHARETKNYQVLQGWKLIKGRQVGSLEAFETQILSKQK